MNNIKICFIISCKINKNYKSYLSFYVNNINTYYSNAKIILVDNNSKHKDIYKEFDENKNIIILENTSDSKFELGAYNFAIEYIITNNLSFDYYICTQDTMVLENYYDFNNLKVLNIKACPIYLVAHNLIGYYGYDILKYFNLYEENENYYCCWCFSFIVDHESLLYINNLTKNIIIQNRYKPDNFERFKNDKVYAYTIEFESALGKILYKANNNKLFCLDGDMDNRRYDCHTIDLDSEEAKNTGHFFVKLSQKKTENTEE